MGNRFFVMLLVAVMLFSFCVKIGYAAEGENKVIRFFKNVVNWPLSVTKKGSETVGKTAARSIKMTTTTASSAVETVTGKPEKIKDVVVEPIIGTGETAKIAIEGSVETPVEGTRDAFEN